MILVSLLANFGCKYGAAAVAAATCSSVGIRPFGNGSPRIRASRMSSGSSPLE
jgi:hypothetical protein